MPRFYKILIFILFLLILGALFLYFSPASTKEIKIEGKEELASENSIEPDNKEAFPSENNTNEIIEKNVEPAVKEKTSETTENKNSSDSLRIVSKLVSWGYSKPQNSRTIDTIILHSSYNALGGDKYNLAKLIEEYKEYGVSPHYLIDREGGIYQLVNDKNIAYHAGVSKVPDGRTGVNDFSIGVEVINTKSESPNNGQYSALKDLTDYLKNKYKIKYIFGHSDIASGRKDDPWNFNWEKIK